MSKKIKITQTLNNSKDKEIIKTETRNHIQDVSKVMNRISEIFKNQSLEHDITKITDFDNYYNAIIDEENEFKESEWYKKHIINEKHHLDRVHNSEINLLDIIENITNEIVDSKGKTGDVNKNLLDMNLYTLLVAYYNTINFIDEITDSEIIIDYDNKNK